MLRFRSLAWQKNSSIISNFLVVEVEFCTSRRIARSSHRFTMLRTRPLASHKIPSLISNFGQWVDLNGVVERKIVFRFPFSVSEQVADYHLLRQ